MELNEIDKIEIRSEEVQDILGAAPAWIIRAGISVILFVVILLLFGSWFFKYPDIVQSRITLTTQNPPASLKAMSSGKIANIFVNEKEEVKENQIIAIIENTANYKDILDLEAKLISIEGPKYFSDKTLLTLGELQSTYSTYSRLTKDYLYYEKLNYYNKKIESIRKQKEDFGIYFERLLSQKKYKEKELSLANKQFDRDKKLFNNEVYSRSEFEAKEKIFLKEKLSFENILTTIANTQMQINQLDQQILDLQLQDNRENSKQQIAIEEALGNLKSQIKLWKQKYLISSPIDGKVTFTNIWSKNQNIQIGEIVATVIPTINSNIIGKVEIPATGVGKVKLNQNVNIKFDNFPYMEFGLLRGSIKSISLIPIQTSNGSIYTAEIEIPDTLISNYGKHLKFSQEMTGTAEIITDDIRLLERFFSPFKSIWRSNVE